MDEFNSKILDIIEKFSYDVFVVQQNKDVDCTCIRHETKQADPKCPKCLGTGKKIKIKRIKAASQESDIAKTMRPTSGIMITRNYYINAKYNMKEDNLIVDGDEVYYVYQVRNNTGFHGERAYSKCLCPTKKMDTKIFMTNFNKIIGR